MDESRVRDLLPDLVAGRLAADEAAEAERAVAAGGDELADELRVLRVLAAGRPTVPEGLAGRIRGAVAADRAPGRPEPRHGAASVRGPRFAWALPSWGFAAAAVAVLALGTTLALDGRGFGEAAQSVLAGSSETSTWMSEDVMVAGAPVLEGLSDETLETLLEELGG